MVFKDEEELHTPPRHSIKNHVRALHFLRLCIFLDRVLPFIGWVKTRSCSTKRNHGPKSNVASTSQQHPDHIEVGVSKVEVFSKVLYKLGRTRKILLWLLGISNGLTMFVYALDQGLTMTVINTMPGSTF